MYKVNLTPEKIIEVIYEGALNIEEYRKADKEVSTLLDTFPQRAALVLIDISKLTTHTGAGRRAAIESAKNMANCRVAFFTPHILNRALTGLVISAANRTEYDKVFKNKEDAYNWIMSIREDFLKGMSK